RELKKDIPWRLEAICLKAMRRLPQERYHTAKPLAADLAGWMRDDEIIAAPDRWPDRLSRLSRRHRVATAALLLSSVALLLAWSWVDWSRTSASHEQALRIAQDRQS